MAENVGDIQEKEGDDFFLDLIRARRNFFSKESPDYKDSNVVQNAMQEISDIIGQPGKRKASINSFVLTL